MKIPFNVYDFFGYLAVGFLVLVSIDFACNGGWLLNDNIIPVYALFWVLMAYIIGHITAHVASFLLENLFVQKFLGSPEEHLLGEPKLSWKARLFPGNFKPLPKKAQERILARVSELGGPETGRALFFHCYAIVKSEPDTRDRLSIFLARYGFCRNISLASLLVAGSLILGPIRCPATAGEVLPWLPVALAIAVGMLYRYLKFFRHYTVEVLTSYAEVTPRGPSKE
jgi:hypothetical protein